MKKIVFLIAICAFLLSCGSDTKNEAQPQTGDQVVETKEPTVQTTPQKKHYKIESGYVKYKSKAAGQELIREWWFDQYGARQYEENYMDLNGKKTGGKALILDGFRYQWDYDATSGQKMKYYHSETDYDQVDERDIKRYGIVKHGFEEVLGKKCEKITTEKPKSTTWVWNNIPLKTEAVFGGNKVVMEAIEIVTDNVDSKLFVLPSNITFTEMK